MSNFWKRALFGALFVAILIGAVLLGQFTALGILTLITVLGLWELYGLCEADEIYPQKIPGILMGIGPFVLAGIFPLNNSIVTGFCGAMFIFPFLLFFFELLRRKSKPFANIALTFFGVIYISVPLILFFVISLLHTAPSRNYFDFFSYHPNNLLGYFFILWSYDTGAYLAGSKFGKHRLWERISPKKSWEGVMGGALLALIVACVTAHYFTSFRAVDWIVIACIIIITGTLGDLVKSMFKRSINIKDSGNIIPGHGGILDRFDALFLSAPFVLFYLFLIK